MEDEQGKGEFWIVVANRDNSEFGLFTSRGAAGLMFDTDGHLMRVLDCWPRTGEDDDYEDEYEDAKLRYEELMAAEREKMYDENESVGLKWVFLVIAIVFALAVFASI